MAVCAVVDLNSNVVVNMIVAEVTDAPPGGCKLIEISESLPGGIGWSWDGTQFINPNPPVNDVLQ